MSRARPHCGRWLPKVAHLAKYSRTRTAAVTGAAAAALLLPSLPKLEGWILRGYKDPIGIVTACAGHTKTAKLGKAYTQAECEELLDIDTAEHAKGVLACTPGLKGKTGPLAAATSFAFNVGTGAYCRSTMASMFNAENYAAGCNQLLRWTYAGGKEWPGLVTRRKAELAVCLS